MITSAGTTQIINFFGQQTKQVAGMLALGVGATAESSSDSRLAFEVTRIQVVVAPDLSNSRLVFKGTLNPSVIGTIYEIGLFSESTPPADQLFPIADGIATAWTNATVVTTNARANLHDLKIDAATSATTRAELSGFSRNLSSFQNTNVVRAAFTADANTAEVRVRIGNSATVYREYVFSNPAVGYNVMNTTLAAGTDTGTVDLSALTYMAVQTTAKSSGATSVYFDGFKVESGSSSNVLVARKVLSTPQVVDTSIPTDIEYSLAVSIA